MENCPIVSFVLNSVHDLDAIPLLESIQGLRVEFLLSAKPEGVKHCVSSSPIKVFEPLKEMAGYIRGLSEELRSSHLIVAVNPYGVAGFQAMNAAKKYNIPFGVAICEVPSVACIIDKEKDRMRSAVFSEVDFALYSNKTSRDYLSMEGIKSDLIHGLEFLMRKEYGFSFAKRNKFRSYIKVDDRTQLVLCPSYGCVSTAKEFLQAIKLVSSQEKDFSASIKFILTFEGDADDLRYLASDLDISRYLIFINQDIGEFHHDILAASDLVLEPPLPICRGFLPLGLRAVANRCRIVSLAESPSLEHISKTEECLTVIDSHFFVDWAKGIRQSIEKSLEVNSWPKFAEPGQSQIGEMLVNILKTDVRSRESEHELQDLLVELEIAQSKNMVDQVYDISMALLEEESMTKAKRSEIFENLGLLELGKGNLETATEYLQTAVESNKKLWKAYLGLAKIAVLSHSEEEAAVFFRKVLAIRPYHPEALAGIGTVYRALEMPEEALYWLNKSLAVDFSNRKVLLSLTQACMECENHKLALKALEQVRLQVGDDRSILMAVGQILVKMGHHEEGKVMIQLAMDNGFSMSEDAKNIRIG